LGEDGSYLTIVIQ